MKTIGRQEARDLIFGTMLESAGEGALDSAETGLLDWLAQTWNVKIEIGKTPRSDRDLECLALGRRFNEGCAGRKRG